MAFFFKAEDMAKGTRINSYYKEYLPFQKYDIEKIRKTQQEKLDLLILHAWNNVPWYKKQMENAGFNEKNKIAVSELKYLPVLNRYDIQEYRNQMLWENYKGKIFNGSSSGTTGIPIKYSQDINSYSSGVAANHVLMGLSGWTPGMRSVHIWGNMESVKQWNKTSSKIKQKINNRKNIASTLINNTEQIGRITESIIKFRPEVIEGYTNSIYELADYLKEENIRIPSVRKVFTTAENLEDYQKEQIEKIIAPVSDMYGCGEINGVACRPVKENKYYIFDPHVIVETDSADNSEMKEILVTNLNNYYMPLIRYRVGDLIDDVYPASSSNPFPFSYFTKIYGRTADHIVLKNGKKIFPINIFGGTLYRKYSAIKRHKTIWNGEKLIFVFEISGDMSFDALNVDIRRSLFGFEVEYEIQTTPKLLPSPNGKYKYFEKLQD
jgi:phenylacetate-CoA ligase